MIKTFESFNKGDNNSDFSEVLDGLRLLYNDSYPGISSRLDTMGDDLYNNIMDDENLFKYSKDINIGDIKQSDRLMLSNIYNELYDKYQLDKFPDMDRIDGVFSYISDLTETEITILTDERKIRYIINTIPDVRRFPNRDKIPFNIDVWDSIVCEIKPAVKRIQDMGYVVETTILSGGNIGIEVSL